MNASNVSSQTSFEELDLLDDIPVILPLPLPLLVPLTAAYGLIFIAGVLGNVSTCIVIARNRSMHTATNFYLFSLAISDLILLICGLPFELYQHWAPQTYPFGEANCIATGFASEISANATVLTITAFTVERYIAICKPFISHTMSKLSRAVRFIVAIWVLALFTAVPQAMQYSVIIDTDKHGRVSESCTVIGAGVYEAFVVSGFIFFVVPMSVISVLYALIGAKLRTSPVLQPQKKPSVESNDRNRNLRYRSGRSQQRVIYRMLVAVALSFFICWAPFHVQRLLAIYGRNLEYPSYTLTKVYEVLNYISGLLYYLSTAINPLLYSIMSYKFRNAFKVTLSSWCSKTPRYGRTYRSLLASQRLRAHTQTELARPRPLRRLSTATTQLCDAPRAQCVNGRDLSTVSESPTGNGNHWQPWRPSMGSPRSISNSSLREIDDEVTGEELATFMYQVNCDIGGGPT